jgi:drug/metabolite transporter (DMT)-like permease
MYTDHQNRWQQIVGWLAVFGSTFFFYLATVIIRWSKFYVTIEASYFVFSRFLLGFIVVCLAMIWTRRKITARRYHYLLGRTIANSIAVFCFYKAVETSSLAEANILNMTYPLFVTLFSWFLIKEQRDLVAIIIVLVAFFGVWLVLNPGAGGAGLYNVWGVMSGVSAAFAIIYLNKSRRYHDSQTILFFMFGLGALLIYCFFYKEIFIPNSKELLFLVGCSLAGVLGQYMLTYGFYFVTAVEGSVISSTRILLAAILGPLLALDPVLSAAGWTGALLIFSANICLAARRARSPHKLT